MAFEKYLEEPQQPEHLSMRIGRTLPPAAAPIHFRDIVSGLKGLLHGQKELDRFESELKDYFGVKHCFLVSSGKAALTVILQALHLMHPDRDEVLVPAYTCYSVPSAITRAGLKVKLCDLDPYTLDFDYDSLSQMLSPTHNESGNKPGEAQINSDRFDNPQSESAKLVTRYEASARLLAVVPTHLFGHPANMRRILRIVNDPGVTIIEDAAQAMGGEWDGKKLGTHGHVSFFSLGRGKVFSTVEGGIILTDRDDISHKIRSLIKSAACYNTLELTRISLEAISLTLFIRPYFFWFPKSLPFLRLGETIYDPHFKIRKMSSFQAGLSEDWQARLKNFQRLRDKNTAQWKSVLMNDCRYLPFSENETQSHFIRFPVRIRNVALKKKILKKSLLLGLGVTAVYPDSIAGIRELKQDFQGQDFPVARQYAQELVTLPIHSFVTKKDVAKISEFLSAVTPQD